jgi:hypothetical protein
MRCFSSALRNRRPAVRLLRTGSIDSSISSFRHPGACQQRKNAFLLKLRLDGLQSTLTIILLHRVDDNSPGGVSISISSVLLQGMVDHIVGSRRERSHELRRVDHRKPKRTDRNFHIPAIAELTRFK